MLPCRIVQAGSVLSGPLVGVLVGGWQLPPDLGHFLSRLGEMLPTSTSPESISRSNSISKDRIFRCSFTFFVPSNYSPDPSYLTKGALADAENGNPEYSAAPYLGLTQVACAPTLFLSPAYPVLTKNQLT